jgi:hypothetical protein
LKAEPPTSHLSHPFFLAWTDEKLRVRNESAGVKPTGDNETAVAQRGCSVSILATLTPDAYTAIVRGKDNTTGIALVEAYQLDN